MIGDKKSQKPETQLVEISFDIQYTQQVTSWSADLVTSKIL